MDSRTACFEGRLESHSPSRSQAVDAGSFRDISSDGLAIECNMTEPAQHINWNGNTQATIKKSLGKGKRKAPKSPGRAKLSGQTVRNSGSTLRVHPEIQVVITRKPLTPGPDPESNTPNPHSVRNKNDTTHPAKPAMGSPTHNDVRQETNLENINHDNPFGGCSKPDDDDDMLMIYSRSDEDARTNKIDQDHPSSVKARQMEQAPSYERQITPHSPRQTFTGSSPEENNSLQQRYFNVTGLDGRPVGADYRQPKQTTRCLSCGALGHTQRVCPGLNVSIIAGHVCVPSTYMAYQPFLTLSRYLCFNSYLSRPPQRSPVADRRGLVRVVQFLQAPHCRVPKIPRASSQDP